MLYWIYDIPTWQLGALFALLFVGATWLGILFLSPIIRIWLKRQEGINDLVGYAFSGFGVYYGLLLGLLAVATYQNLSDVEATVSREAASLGALYRNVSSYPEPTRTTLTAQLRNYTVFVIEKAWPAQRRGEQPQGSAQMMDEFQEVLTHFEPVTKGQEILHAETLRQYTSMIELRRLRLQSIDGGIPRVMWYVVLVGALVNTLLLLCFRMRLDIHLILGGAVSLFVGAVIFLVVVMDCPFRGRVSIGPDAFQLILSSLMNR